MFGLPRTDAVSAAEAGTRQRAGVVLVDVREVHEWSAGHAPGARHVPLAQVPRVAAELAGQRVMTICRSGSRSASAARVLARAGVEVVNVSGGMAAWQRAGLPVVRDDGSAGTVA